MVAQAWKKDGNLSRFRFRKCSDLYKLLNKRRQVKIERPTQPEYNDPGFQFLLNAVFFSLLQQTRQARRRMVSFRSVVQRPPDNLQAAPFSSVPAPSLSQICTNAFLF
jgi:hypothetical protein